MKREIKFRAWDNSGRVILYLTFSQTPLGYIHKFVNYDYGVKELMQFTGLYDKYGKEIYEGDIVKCFHYEIDIPEDYFSIFSVEYNDKQGLYCVGKAHNISLARHRDIEIVGNIYENPELLK